MKRLLILLLSLSCLGADIVPIGGFSLRVKANPTVGLAPMRVQVTATLNGFSERFYCPGVEWEWGDGTRSYQESDCPPLTDGVDFPRKWSKTHTYGPGEYTIKIKLVKVGKVVLQGETNIYVLGEEMP